MKFRNPTSMAIALVMAAMSGLAWADNPKGSEPPEAKSVPTVLPTAEPTQCLNLELQRRRRGQRDSGASGH